MKKIIVQAGHINCQNNVITALKNNTGAPNEQELNKRIADRVSGELRKRGFQVIQTDACANSDPAVTKADADLFLALHGDSDTPNDNGGGFADFPEPSTDGATKESQRIAGIFNTDYFKETQIVYKNASNANTRYYYMWKYLTAKTPCVLLEMGQTNDPHDKVLLGNTDLIANAIVRVICKAFGVAYDLPSQQTTTTTPTPVQPDYKKMYEEEQKVTTQLKTAIDTIKSETTARLADKDKECQSKIESLKALVVKTVQEFQ